MKGRKRPREGAEGEGWLGRWGRGRKVRWTWLGFPNLRSLGSQEAGREGGRCSSGGGKADMAARRCSFCTGGKMMVGREEEMEETSFLFSFFTFKGSC